MINRQTDMPPQVDQVLHCRLRTRWRKPMAVIQTSLLRTVANACTSPQTPPNNESAGRATSYLTMENVDRRQGKVSSPPRIRIEERRDLPHSQGNLRRKDPILQRTMFEGNTEE